ncbi:FkbM family methyltransferase [Leptolyngbya sp. NIES-2104]|uniref:FkbM family methyltransferase n=1 Tax=Leptolyngbya sp. NIES-2104 TaxID=1552121 RepID=UPI0006ECC290|nr:FkbM family methyltransferase [Leptolyngbya sp. NIES-2104]GAP97625.1 methyltransferase FkbM [Leptolyngbya sp. NIES-2104]
MGIRQILRKRCPWKIVRSPFLRYFAFQDPIDCIFYTYSLNHQPSFIQIGSNDGINGDPIYGFILKWNWSGIKVEPVRYVFEKLEKNFRDFPNIALENSAIAKESNAQKFYYLRQDENAPEWYSQLGSFSLPTILKHEQWIPDLQERLISCNVVCQTFEQLCYKYDVREIDVIHIDTEGYDFEIIKLIDFRRFSPSIVLYEHKHLSQSDQAACRQYLEEFGYQFISTPRDTLAVLDTNRIRKAWSIVGGSV